MTLLEGLSGLKDPRRNQGKRTGLIELLVMSILSICCGSVGYRGISRFCKVHQKELTDLLSLKHSIPSHVTFSTVLQKISLSEFISLFNNWSNDFCVNTTGDWICADGKVLRSTVSDCHSTTQDFQAIVSLFCQNSGLVYKLDSYHNKEKAVGEQSIIRSMVSKMKDLGMIITLDALHSQKKQ